MYYRRSFAIICIFALLIGLATATPCQADSVMDHGTAGDGVFKDTAAVQAGIDAVAASGGGTLLFPPGVYLCGSLHMKSGVTLHLDPGATILGSKDVNDYDPYEVLPFENDADEETSCFQHALIWGENLERVGIVGGGTIDSNYEKRHGPKPIALKRCRDVTVRDIRILNAPNYCISLLGTDDVLIDGVTIRNAYCDGIDPDSCRNVRISNCDIQSRDDCIVPKASFALGERRSTENIVVTNCLLATPANAFKLGTESGGDFKRIAFSNSVVYLWPEDGPATSGISLESVDGSHLDGVVISNITMTGIDAPLFIRLGNRGRDMDTPVPGTLRNVSISNIVATGATLTSSITGIPGHRVEGVTISDLRIVYAGNETDPPALAEVPEREDAYPSANMFKTGLPAYGLFCRHVDGLTLRNVQLLYEGNEKRSALVCDDVHNLRMDGFDGQASEASALMAFNNVTRALLRGCVAPQGTNVFLDVSGAQSQRIVLDQNHLLDARKTVETAGDVREGAVISPTASED